jgi:hypothetical protein
MLLNHAWRLQNKLITVTPDTKVLKAMQLMTGITPTAKWGMFPFASY